MRWFWLRAARWCCRRAGLPYAEFDGNGQSARFYSEEVFRTLGPMVKPGLYHVQYVLSYRVGEEMPNGKEGE